MFARLGRFAYRRRRRIIAVWAVLFVLGITVGSQAFSRTTSDLDGGTSSESVQAWERLDRERVPRGVEDNARGDDFGAVIDGRRVDDPVLTSSVTSVADQIRRIDGVHSVLEPYSAPEEVRAGLLSPDGRTLLVQVVMKRWSPQRPYDFDRAVEDARDLLHRIDAPTVAIGGEMFIDEEFEEQSEKDLLRAEAGSIPLSLLVLVFVIGLVAAGLPLAMAFCGLASTLLVLLGLTYLTDVSIYAINVATMFGLGLSFDYGLLVVNRYREERAAGYDIAGAVERTTATAGVTIAFSALTVAAALSGLFVFDDPILRSLAMGGVAVVLVALAAGMTLLPALLAVAGKRIKPAKSRGTDHGYFYRLSRLVQRRAGAVVILVATLLAVSAVPFLGVRLETDDYRSLPRSSESRAAFTLLAEKFPRVSDDPITVVADVSADDPKARQALTTLQALAGVVAVQPRDPVDYNPGITVVDVVASGPSVGDTAQRVVKAIRGTDFGFRKQVTGEPAFVVDYKAALASRMPWAFAVMALATLVLLFLMTGSVLVPIKAIVMNVLSLGATFGVLVWVFQDGHLSGLLGFDSTGALNTVVPVIVFVFAFGLSMDYEVFLLSRIKEMHDSGHDNDAAVAVGLQRTGRIITSAALLIVLVFLGFVTGELLIMKQMGIGLAVAVIVDATIVRSLLVPATMKLLGERNWWAPAPLRRIYDRFGLHEPPESAAVPAPRAAADQSAGLPTT